MTKLEYSKRTSSIPWPSQIARFMGPTWGPPGSFRSQMGPMLTPCTLLSGMATDELASYISCHHITSSHGIIDCVQCGILIFLRVKFSNLQCFCDKEWCDLQIYLFICSKKNSAQDGLIHLILESIGDNTSRPGRHRHRHRQRFIQHKYKNGTHNVVRWN